MDSVAKPGELMASEATVQKVVSVETNVPNRPKAEEVMASETTTQKVVGVETNALNAPKGAETKSVEANEPGTKSVEANEPGTKSVGANEEATKMLMRYYNLRSEIARLEAEHAEQLLPMAELALMQDDMELQCTTSGVAGLGCHVIEEELKWKSHGLGHGLLFSCFARSTELENSRVAYQDGLRKVSELSAHKAQDKTALAYFKHLVLTLHAAQKHQTLLLSSIFESPICHSYFNDDREADLAAAVSDLAPKLCEAQQEQLELKRAEQHASLAIDYLQQSRQDLQDRPQCCGT
eukprot:gene16874-23147_t